MCFERILAVSLRECTVKNTDTFRSSKKLLNVLSLEYVRCLMARFIESHLTVCNVGRNWSVVLMGTNYTDSFIMREAFVNQPIIQTITS